MRNQPPYHTSSPDADAASEASTVGLRPGDKLDKYTIIQQIGAGGMASVWKGHDPVLDTYVAIKEFSSAAMQAHQNNREQDLAHRFREEAQTQKRLANNSPHLVRVLDFIDENRGLFIIMEYVQGKSLEQFLSQSKGPVEQRQALGIVGATAMALGVIHKHNVVHRDLKPSNILLPDEGGLKVSDFGIAAIMGEQEAMAVGSVRYMAPELFREEPIDGRADIYSLGMIAYEMLAGREKFNEAFKVVLRDQRNQALRWMKWHTNARAKAPPLSQINPDISPELSELVSRMMEKDTALRVESSKQLLDAMRRLFAPGQKAGDVAQTQIAQEPVAIPSSNPTAALPKRSKMPYILAAILLVQVLIGGGMFLYSQNEKANLIAQQHDEARQQLMDAANAYKAGDTAEAERLYTSIASTWATENQLAIPAKAGVLLAQARQDIDAGLYDQALGKIDQAADYKVFKTETLDALRLEARNRSAFEGETKAITAMMDQNDLGMAATRLEKFRETTDEERKVIASLNERLQALQAKSRDARTINEATQERNSKGLAAGINFLDGQLAARPSQQVRALRDEWNLQQRHESLLTQARTEEAQGKFDEAINTLAKAQQIKEQPQQAEQIKRLRIRVLLTQAARQVERNRNDQAVDAYTAVLGLDKDNKEAKDALARIKTTNQRDAFLRSARAAMGRNDYDQAIVQFQNALDIEKDDKILADLNSVRLVQAIALANTALEKNEMDKARTYIETATRLAPDNQQARDLMAQLGNKQEFLKFIIAGDAFREQGKFSDAQLQYLRAQRVANNAQVQQRLADTEVAQLLAKARYHAMKEDWRVSQALLRTLLAIRPNEEAIKLLEDVSKQLPNESLEENATTP